MSPPPSSRSDGLHPPEQDTGLVPAPPREAIDSVLLAALDEDGIPQAWAPPGKQSGPARSPSPTRRRLDLTSEAALPEQAMAKGRLVAKAAGVLCGITVFARVLELCDPKAEVDCLAVDGERVVPGQELLRVVGKARGLLYAERTGLNFVQRLSGIATLTARYVERCGGRARVLDTRKTTPNLRLLEKYAVRCGGGVNHRFGLFDEAMVKNNHADLAGMDLAALVRRVRAEVGPAIRITSEARNLGEAFAGVDADADVILLDNFAPADLARSVTALRDRARGRSRQLELEASGGINEENISQVAASGVDLISIGALTHSAAALDFSFYLRPV